MQIENHKEEVPFAFYEEKFRALDPASVQERLKDVSWDGKEFTVTILGRTFEISSMGIRVDAESMDRQLRLAGCDNRRELPFHKMVLNDELPLTMGGGIGQSRLCMLLLGSAHIGEVQASIWSDETYEAFAKAGVTLL